MKNCVMYENYQPLTIYCPYACYYNIKPMKQSLSLHSSSFYQL